MSSNIRSCVECINIWGALPAWCALTKLYPPKHQLYPGLTPGKLYSGIGVERSLPASLEYSKNSLVA